MMENGVNPKIVVVGNGYWGKNIIRNVHQQGALYGICDVSEASRMQAQALYPMSKIFTHFEEVFADGDVDAVMISTPAETHARLAIAAMKAGKDVFVEKPLALTVEDGQKMVETAEQTGKILMVGHLLEYHGAIVALEQAVKAGTLGEIQYIYSNRLNLGKFRREENILWSFAPHDVAVILRLLKQNPTKVWATGSTYLQPNITDLTITHLQFATNVRAHIFVSWLHPFKEQKLVVVGSKKMAVFDDSKEGAYKLQLYDKGADWVEDMPVPRQGEVSLIPFSLDEPLSAEVAHFLDCIVRRKQPITDGKSGLNVLKVLAEAQKSLFENE
jgi:predicted dehydrogenase